MSQGCANHPESMALSTCKVCQKSICLMCVHEEKDGTFCSEACISNFREVNDWVGGGPPPAPAPAAQPQSVAVEAPPASAASVFEEMPEGTAAVSHPDPVPIPEEAPPEPPPAPAAPSIGNPCHAHPDIRAKAFCRRCRKPICGLCIVENAAGMFCSDVCVASSRGSRKAGAGAKIAVVALVLVAAAGVAYALGLFKGAPEGPTVTETPKPRPAPPKDPPSETEPTKAEPVKPTPPKPEVVKRPEPPKPPPPPPVVSNDPPRPLPPPPPKPEPPRPTILIHPWGRDEPGMWYRVRRGDKVEDVGLKERDPVSYTVTKQAWSGGAAQGAVEKKVEIEPIELMREEPVEIEGRTYLCEVRRIKNRLEWTLVTGRHAGAVLRMESPEGSHEAVRLWEHTITMGDRSFDCLVVEARENSGAILKSWYCPAYPMKTPRVEREGAVIEALVSCGYDWGSRPAPKK